MTARREALIIANDDYLDPGLRQLRAPSRDADALARVLSDPEVGGFAVRELRNQPAHVINEAIEGHFADREHDDLLLVHFSCHGVKDEEGSLYLAAANTKLCRLAATGVSADFVSQQMDRSRSRRIVLLLDCCYAGAFARGLAPRSAGDLGIDRHLGGRGRAVITASSALEYAFEGGLLADGPVGTGPSVFTGALVRGLATGAADRDGDGVITLDELYDYVYAGVRDVTPHQTPGKWIFDMRGSLHIARRPGATPAPEPASAVHPELPIAQATVRPAARRRFIPARWARAVRGLPRWAAIAGALIGFLATTVLLLVQQDAFRGDKTPDTATSPPAGSRIFWDDFTTKAADWPSTGAAAPYGGYYVPGAYRYWSRDGGTTGWSTPRKAPTVYPVAPPNIRVTTQARWSARDDSAWFGVACRVVRASDAYLFVISQGAAAIVKVKNDGYDQLVAGSLTGVDVNAPVRLAADCATVDAYHATRLVLWVNGRQIVEHTDRTEPLAAGSVGVAVEMGGPAVSAEAHFDSFAVDRL